MGQGGISVYNCLVFGLLFSLHRGLQGTMGNQSRNIVSSIVFTVIPPYLIGENSTSKIATRTDRNISSFQVPALKFLYFFVIVTATPGVSPLIVPILKTRE